MLHLVEVASLHLSSPLDRVRHLLLELIDVHVVVLARQRLGAVVHDLLLQVQVVFGASFGLKDSSVVERSLARRHLSMRTEPF